VKKSRVIGSAALALALFGVLTAEGCDESNPTADSDSAQNYGGDHKVDVDEKTYVITGEVVREVNSLTRQVTPAKGDVFGYGGYVSGSFTGPVEAGKGFVRLKVQVSNPSTAEAPVGEVAIIKTTDTKVTALMAGDVITVKCRRQYENIAAVKEGQKFNKDEVGTWELDYCRLASPVIQIR
jgi:hypothetical protein